MHPAWAALPALALLAFARPDAVRISGCLGNGAPLVGIAAPAEPYALKAKWVVWTGSKQAVRVRTLATIACDAMPARVQLKERWPESKLWGCLGKSCVRIKPRDDSWVDPDRDPNYAADLNP